MKSMSGLISFLLLTTAFGVIAGVQSLHLDFPLTDGAYYFDRAHLFAASEIRPDREWSPLFVIGYGIHHWIFPSGYPLLLYLTHRLLVLYAVLFLFWLLSRRLFPEPLALLLSIGFLGHGTLLYDYPVVHVAGVGVLLVLLLGAFSPRTPGVLPILLGLSCLGIWVRPRKPDRSGSAGRPGSAKRVDSPASARRNAGLGNTGDLLADLSWCVRSFLHTTGVQSLL